MPDFEPGRVYRRRTDIHDRFGGQRQGGISTPAGKDYVFLFTGDAGAAYGYRDEFRDDGMFWYTGEGQRGDMELARGNQAIREHVADGRALHLFEDAGRGVVRYVG